jgi:TPR repeat protein
MTRDLPVEGTVLTREKLLLAEQMLVNSGRFIQVEFSPEPPGEKDGRITLNIVLQEAGNVPMLSEVLSELQEACLSFGAWVRNLAESGEEIRIRFSFDGTHVITVAASASNDLAILISDGGFRELVATDIRVAFLLDSGTARLLQPPVQKAFETDAGNFEVKLNVSVSPAGPEPGQKGRFFAGIGSRFAPEVESCIQWELDVPPSVFLSLTGNTNAIVTFDGAILSVMYKDLEGALEFDSRAGRLKSMEFTDPETSFALIVEAATGLFEQTLSVAEASPSETRTHQPGIVFAGHMAVEILTILTDLAELDRDTEDILNRTAAILGIFVDAGHVLPLEEKTNGRDDLFTVPSNPRHMNNPTLSVMIFLHDFLSERFPANSWPVVVSREAAMMTAGVPQFQTSSLRSLLAGDETGPAGCLILSDFLQSLQHGASAAFAEKGVTLLSEEAFRKDVDLVVYALNSFEILDPARAYLDEVDWSMLGDTIAGMVSEEHRQQCRKEITAIQDIPMDERLGAFGSALWRRWNLEEALRLKLEGLASGQSASIDLKVEESSDGSTIRSLTMAAKDGDPEAQNNLGVMYQRGQGVVQDYGQAAKWYTLAAEQGLVIAQDNLGLMYAGGHGVAQNYEAAVKWFAEAAEQGYPASQHNLGVLCARGLGTPRDMTRAIEWYTRAAGQGYAAAQYNLGVIYENGQGVPQDYGQAIGWYTKAAEQGRVEAQFHLGYMYANGHGVAQDFSRAMEWYTKAAEQGFASAQCNIGVMYHRGQGTVVQHSGGAGISIGSIHSGHNVLQRRRGRSGL